MNTIVFYIISIFPAAVKTVFVKICELSWLTLLFRSGYIIFQDPVLREMSDIKIFIDVA